MPVKAIQPAVDIDLNDSLNLQENLLFDDQEPPEEKLNDKHLERIQEVLRSKSKSTKVIWTFWFLVRFVLFQALIPIIIALPFIYIVFRLEFFIFIRDWTVSLIYYWVLAFIFAADLTNLCHWFQYTEQVVIDELIMSTDAPEQESIKDSTSSVYAPPPMHSSFTTKDAFSAGLDLAKSSLRTTGPRRNATLVLQKSMSSTSNQEDVVVLPVVRRASMIRRSSYQRQPSFSQTNDRVLPMNPINEVAKAVPRNMSMAESDAIQEELDERNDAESSSSPSIGHISIPLEVSESPPIEIISSPSVVSAKQSPYIDPIPPKSTDLSSSKPHQPPNFLVASFLAPRKTIGGRRMTKAIIYDPTGEDSAQRKVFQLPVALETEYLKSGKSRAELLRSNPSLRLGESFYQSESKNKNLIDSINQNDKIFGNSFRFSAANFKSDSRRKSNDTSPYTNTDSGSSEDMFSDEYKDLFQSVADSNESESSKSLNIQDSAQNRIVEKIEEDENIAVQRIWSPWLFLTFLKLVFRAIVTPIYGAFTQLTSLIFLITYPLLVVPGGILAHMLVGSFSLYPILLRLISSIVVVFTTESVKQILFYGMILPLAFIDLTQFNGAVAGILKALLFLVARNLIKFSVLATDRQAVKAERDRELAEALKKGKKESKENAPETSATGKALEVVFEDEITDLTNYGQLIFGLGGQGVPGWIFILRIEDPFQFWIATGGSIFLEALITITWKRFLEWLEKRKMQQSKKEAKKNEQMLVGPKMLKDKDKQRKLKQDKAIPKEVQEYMKNIKLRTDIPKKKNIVHPSPNNEKDDANVLTERTKAFLASSFNQDNRRAAVERRFVMISSYTSIIGAAAIYLISLSGDPSQHLCDVYGLVTWDVILWRCAVVLGIQFLVDLWFTTNLVHFGLPFSFTSQIEIHFVQGFLLAMFAVLQSMFVFMAHERGLFGACHPMAS